MDRPDHHVLVDFLGESLTTLVGAASSVEGVVFPSTVFPDGTPFLKVLLLKFVSPTSSPSVVAFVFR
jgi:hypothetical protein